jgi:glycosyltransferase involved in cell wall biosynthesis
MTTLSVIIITKNEAHRIRTCLESIKWANEIIVLDSGSTDDTLNICREYTDNVFETDWPGFGPQKNRALEKASCEWILSLDADEEVSAELKISIQNSINQKHYDAYELHRLTEYCGKVIKHGGWGKDYLIRLFKKNYGTFSNRMVHETIEVQGSVGKLNGTLYHFSFENLSEVIQKMDFYSTQGAAQRFSAGKKSNLFIALIRSKWMFFKSYFLHCGFLDGREGFILALSSAMNTFYCYMKLAYLWRKK